MYNISDVSSSGAATESQFSVLRNLNSCGSVKSLPGTYFALGSRSLNAQFSQIDTQFSNSINFGNTYHS